LIPEVKIEGFRPALFDILGFLKDGATPGHYPCDRKGRGKFLEAEKVFFLLAIFVSLPVIGDIPRSKGLRPSIHTGCDMAGRDVCKARNPIFCTHYTSPRSKNRAA
jgi:hypothetical protein